MAAAAIWARVGATLDVTGAAAATAAAPVATTGLRGADASNNTIEQASAAAPEQRSTARSRADRRAVCRFCRR